MPYKRKTVDEYEIQGLYPAGWEMETTEITRMAAREAIRTYRHNCPGTAFRIKKLRVSIDTLTDEQRADYRLQA